MPFGWGAGGGGPGRRWPDVGRVVIADIDGKRAREAAEFARCDWVRVVLLLYPEVDMPGQRRLGPSIIVRPIQLRIGHGDHGIVLPVGCIERDGA